MLRRISQGILLCVVKMKKIFLIILIALAGGGIFFGTQLGHSGKTNSNFSQDVQQVVPGENTQQQKTTVSNSESEYAVPKTIHIPKIKVDAPIESVGQDAKKAMDVPKDSDNAGWYNLGVKPGEKGNAVLDGHLDKSSGAPAIFWNVSKLSEGDKIVIDDVNGKSHTFSVTKNTKYPYDNFPLQEVFGPTGRRMLNLISCNGVWNSKTHNYSQRTVVYAEMIQ